MRSAISERYPPAVIDAHAHLTDRRFAGDLADVLERARKAGVERILTAAATCQQQQRPLFPFLIEAVEAYQAGRSAPSLVAAP